MSTCKLFSTNHNLYNIIKQRFQKFSGNAEDFNKFVSDSYIELKSGPYKTLIEKFVIDEDIAQIANEIIAEDPERFSAIVSSNIQSELSKKFKKTECSIIPFFSTNKSIREPFKTYQSAYDYMESEFKINMFKSAFINKESGLIIQNDNQLNKFITEYKNELFNKLKNYIEDYSEDMLYDENYNVNSDLYHQVMNNPRIINLQNANINISNLRKIHRDSIFDPFNAIYILHNFDKLIKNLLPGIININEDYFGYLENGIDLQKYTLSEATLQSLYWKEDTDEVKDASLYVSNVMKLISSVIPLIDNNGNQIFGKYLGRNALYKISALIKKEEMENMKNPGFQSFISNPRKMLKEYLTNSKYKSLFNQKIVKSLSKFLYDSSSIKKNDINISDYSIEEIQNKTFDNSSIKDGNLTQGIDLLGLIGFEISKIVSPEYKKYTSDASTNIELTSLDETTGFVKDSFKLNILSYLDENDSNNNFLIKNLNIDGVNYDINLNNLKALSSKLINSVEFKNYFFNISGFELSQDLINKLNNESNGRAVAVIKRITEDLVRSFELIKRESEKIIYQDTNNLQQLEDFIDKTIFESFDNDFYVSFSKALSTEIDSEIITTIEDSQGNKIPLYRLNSAMFNDSYFISNYDYNNNIFKQNPGLFSAENNLKYNTSTSLRLEGQGYDTVKKASTFSYMESYHSSFFGDFLTSIYKNDIFSTQPVAYSDKGSILLKNVNLNAKIIVSNEVYELYKNSNIDKSFIPKSIQNLTLSDLSNDALMQYYFENQNKYFNKIINDVIKDWEKLIPELNGEKNIDNAIKIINNFLKSVEPTKDKQFEDGTISKSLYSRILELQQQGININIVNDLHYSKYKNLEFNRNLKYNYDNVKSIDNFKKFFNSNLNTFINDIDLNLLNSARLNKITENQKGYDSIISKIFGKNSKDYEKANSFIRNIQTENSDIDVIESVIDGKINPLYERYLLLTNLIKDQYLALTVKHPYIHKVKGDNSLEDEDSNRVKASMKRMVILPATLENYTQGLLNGVPKKYKVSIIEDDTLPTFNPKGESHKQDIYDGSAWMNPFMSILEEYSLPSKGIKGTKKPIGTYSGNGYSMLFKFAQFPITNELILKSMNSEHSMLEIMRKMNDFKWKTQTGEFLNIDITKNFKDGNFKPSNALNKDLYLERAGNYLKISAIQKNSFNPTEGSKYTIVYNYVDEFGNEIKENGKTKRLKIDSIAINSLFELWQMLGGQYSKELSNGKLINSENSMYATANYMNNIGIVKDSQSGLKGFNFKDSKPIVTEYNTETVYQPLKDYLISILANSSAVKNGITNLNPASVLKGNQDLIYTEIDVTNFGVQLDANHEADFSELTEMSQVISALAANGKTMNEAKEAFMEIQKIIERSLKQTETLIEKTSNPDIKISQNATKALYSTLSKLVVDSLATADKISLAHSIVERLKQNFEDIIPLSNPNFFNLFTTNVLANLNRSSLKRKYAGLGGVLNPSAKVVQMFQSEDGNILTYNDLLNKATEEYKQGLLDVKDDLINLLINKVESELSKNIGFFDLNKQLVDAYIIKYFSPKPISIDKINLFDRVGFEKDGEYVEFKNILTPGDLYEVQNYADQNPDTKWLKDYSKPRDLKPVEITWEEDNDFDYLNKVFELVPNIKNKIAEYLNIDINNISDSDLSKMLNFANKLDLTQLELDVKSAKILTGISENNLEKQLPESKELQILKNKPKKLTQKTLWNLPSIKLKFKIDNLNDVELDTLKRFLNYVELKENPNILEFTYFNRFLSGDKDFALNYLQSWTQKEMELLKNNKIFDESLMSDFNLYFNGIDLREDVSDFSNFKDIYNYNLNEAEIILPKVYRSIYGLDDKSLYEIKTKGVNYFKEKLSDDYDAPIEGLDFFIRTTDKPISIRIGNFTNKKINGIEGIKIKINTETDENDVTYRLDSKGKKMYKLPKGAEIYAYQIDSENVVEVLYMTDPFEQVDEKVYYKDGKLNTSTVYDINSDIIEDFIKSVKNRASLVVLGNNIDRVVKLKLLTDLGIKYNKIQQYKDLYSNISYNIPSNLTEEAYKESLMNMKEALIEEYSINKDLYIDSIAKSMYSSFLKSQQVVSARIPSQALQSFMTMKNVSFTENKSNDIYVSHWQLWLQGSDLDIDKAYTMMYSIDDAGIYDGWSPLFDYSSLERLNLSENLPSPSGLKIGKDIQIDNFNNGGIDLTEYFLKGDNLENLIDILKIINNKDLKFFSLANDVIGIIDKLNLHNTFKYSGDSSKNKVVKNIRTVSNDPRNLLSAYSPISMDSFTSLLKDITSNDKKSIYDGTSIFKIQEENYVGKSTVGVMANGVKAFFTLTQYYNNYFKDKKNNNEELNVLDNAFFIKEFNLNGVKTYKSTVADTLASSDQISILNTYLKQIYPEGYVTHSKNEADLLLSALVSLATDNAKELALAKLNAGLELASMHVYLTILGFSPKEIVGYMTGPIASAVSDRLKGNMFVDSSKTVDMVLKNLKSEKLEGIDQFEDIYNSAQELRYFTNLLSINQGVKSDIYTIHDFTLKLSNGFEAAEDNMFSNSNLKLPLNLHAVIEKRKRLLYKNEIVKLKEDIAKETSKKKPSEKKLKEWNALLEQKLQLYRNPIELNQEDVKNLTQSLYDRIIKFKPYLLNADENVIKEILTNAINLNITGNRLNYDLYFSNENYRKVVTDYYNLIKNTFNYFDIINKSPNFYEMLKSLNITLNSVKKVSRKMKFISEDVPMLIKENQELLKDSQQIKGNPGMEHTPSSYKFIDKSGRMFKYNSDYLKKALDYYDDYVIGDFLSSDNLNHFKFNIADLSNYLLKGIKINNKNVANKNNKIFDLTDAEGIRTFKYLFENYILKDILKKEYKNNAFVKNLQLVLDKKSTNREIFEKSKSYIKLKINMKNLTNPSDINLYFEILNGFNVLSDQNSPIVNVYGKPIKWGELLYVYNLIVNKDKFGPNKLTKIFEDYMQKENSIAYKLAMHYSKFDSNKKDINIDPKNLFFALFGYNRIKTLNFQSLDKKGRTEKITVTDPDYTLLSKLNKNFEINNSEIDKIIFYLKNNSFKLDLNCD